MKKPLLIICLFLTSQFLTAQMMTDNIDPWYTDNVRFCDTVSVYLTDYPESKRDTIKAVLLITACIECPAYTIKGYVVEYSVLELSPFGDIWEQEKIIYLDEFKQDIKEFMTVWDYKIYKWENNNY